MFRVKQTTNPFFENIKNKPIPVILNPPTGFGAIAAKITVLPMQKQKVTPLMRGINVLRSAPVDGLNQQPAVGIARGQQKGFQYNLQLPITHDLNGQIMPISNNFNVALNSKLGILV